MASSVSVRLPSYGYTYTFTGVLSIKHEYSLKLQTDSDSAAGADYINGGPFHNLLIDGAVKARLKLYITNNFGIYAGATGRIGWGAKSASESGSKSSNSYNITNTSWSVDCGIVIGLGQ